MSGSVYVVVGEAGEYSDYRMWLVCWYRDMDHAASHANWANREIQRFVHQREYWAQERARWARAQAGELTRDNHDEFMAACERFEAEHPEPTFEPDPNAATETSCEPAEYRVEEIGAGDASRWIPRGPLVSTGAEFSVGVILSTPGVIQGTRCRNCGADVGSADPYCEECREAK